MARYYGKVGYALTEETAPGVWSETFTEREYYGDEIRNYRRLEPAGKVNDNITIANNISIVADPFAMENFHAIRYAEYMGTMWEVSSVEVQYPRLILTLGGVYNVPAQN